MIEVDVSSRRDYRRPAPEIIAEYHRALSYERCLPRYLVHRQGISEVFVCDRFQADAEETVLAVALPRAHALWADVAPGHHDPSAIVEAVRQCAIVTAHDRFALPSTHVMIAKAFDMAVAELGAFRNDRRHPLEALVLMHSDAVYADTVIAGMRFDSNVLIGDVLAARLSGELRFADATDFTLARSMATGGRSSHDVWRSEGSPVEPEQVDRIDPRNVVITPLDTSPDSDSPYRPRAELLVDPDSPVYFDHELDHVPGQLMTEGARQAALLAVRATNEYNADSPLIVVGGSARFDEFGELDRPTEVVVDHVRREQRDWHVRCRICQQQNTIADLAVVLTSAPTEPGA